MKRRSRLVSAVSAALLLSLTVLVISPGGLAYAQGRTGVPMPPGGSPTAGDLAAAILTPSTAPMLVATSKVDGVSQFEVYTDSLQGFPTHGASWILISSGQALNIAGVATTFYSFDASGPGFAGWSCRGLVTYDRATLTLNLSIPIGATALSFDWKFGTEENAQYTTTYRDTAKAIVTTSAGSTNILLLPGGECLDVDNASLYSNNPGGSSSSPSPPYPSPNDVVYNAVTTGIYTTSMDVSPFAGETITIDFQIGDERDRILDSAIFIDNLNIAYTAQPPSQPPNVSPVNGALCVALPLTLQSGPFSDTDPGDFHNASRWQVRTGTGSYSSPVYDSGIDNTNLASITLATSELGHDTDYYWHVSYQDSHGLWSAWSSETSFRTADTPTGSPTKVTPDSTEVEFTLVTVAGCTYVTRSDTTPASHTDPVTPRIGPFVDVTTTATSSGAIAVGFPLIGGGENWQGSNIRMYHWNGTQWEDVTTWVDYSNGMVYGQVTSLSWFYIGGQWVWIGETAPVFPNIYVGIAVAFGAAIVASILRRRLIRQTN